MTSEEFFKHMKAQMSNMAECEVRKYEAPYKEYLLRVSLWDYPERFDEKPVPPFLSFEEWHSIFIKGERIIWTH